MKIWARHDETGLHYLRPETAWAFVNFANYDGRPHVPFGIGQTGKSFRNEITGNFIFRT